MIFTLRGSENRNEGEKIICCSFYPKLIKCFLRLKLCPGTARSSFHHFYPSAIFSSYVLLDSHRHPLRNRFPLQDKLRHSQVRLPCLINNFTPSFQFPPILFLFSCGFLFTYFIYFFPSFSLSFLSLLLSSKGFLLKILSPVQLT